MAIVYQTLTDEVQRRIVTEALHSYEEAHFRAVVTGQPILDGLEDNITALQERLETLASPEASA